MLKQRILTAVPLAAGFLMALFLLPGWAFASLIGVLVALAGWEWATLTPLRGLRRLGYLAVLGALLAGVGLWEPRLPPVLWALALGLWLALFGMVATFPRGVRIIERPLLRGFLGWAVLPLAYLAVLGLYAAGPLVLLWALGVVWAADIGAYFAGRQFGRRKLAPAVSPGKSWEGALGGAGLALAVSVAFAVALAIPVTPLLLAFSALVVACSVFGDLFESVLKRTAGVKDSGGLLPGHGGLLDRLDALLPALPLAAFGLQALPAFAG